MKRILFIKLGAIGDVVMAAAAMSEFRRINSNTMVDWVVGDRVASFLTALSVADSVIAIPDKSLLTGPKFSRFFSLLKSIKTIFGLSHKYDAIYIGHPNWQYQFLAIPAFIKNPNLIFRRYYRFFPTLTRNRISEHLEFFLAPQALSNHHLINFLPADSLLRLGEGLLNKVGEDLAANESPLGRVVLVPGGSKNLLRDDFLRRWPIDNYVALAKMLIKLNCTIILVGGVEDAWVRHHFQGVETHDLIGKTDLQELVRIFANSNLVITHDTGPLHLASLVTTPLIALFGPTPHIVFSPLGRKELKILGPDSSVVCAPCYDGKNYANCNNPICMKSISVDDVFVASVDLLKIKGSH